MNGDIIVFFLGGIALGFIGYRLLLLRRRRPGEVWFGRNTVDARTTLPTLFCRVYDGGRDAVFVAFDVVASKRLPTGGVRPVRIVEFDDAWELERAIGEAGMVGDAERFNHLVENKRILQTGDFGKRIERRSKCALADFPGRFERKGRGFYLELEFDWLCWHLHDSGVEAACVIVSTIDERDRETVVATGGLTLSEAKSLLGDDVNLPPLPTSDA